MQEESMLSLLRREDALIEKINRKEKEQESIKAEYEDTSYLYPMDKLGLKAMGVEIGLLANIERIRLKEVRRRIGKCILNYCAADGEGR